jgi:hypothetical protein
MMLNDHINDHEKLGCMQAFFGIQSMPEGYALMIDADGIYYYWLRHDGVTSEIHWNRWAVRKGALANSIREATHHALDRR